MLRKLTLAACLALVPALALAQMAVIAPTAPASDNSDKIANTAWVRANGGGAGGTPGGSTTQVQYNNAGAFGGVTNLTADGTNPFLTAIAAPATPAAGFGVIYEDSTNKVLSIKNDAGTISITTVPSSAGAHQFATGISAAGVISFAQPAYTDISGTEPAAGSNGQLQFNNSNALAGVTGSSVDSNGSLTLGGATVTASDPILNLTQTWNNGAVSFSGIKLNITKTAAGSSKIVDVQLGGSPAFFVDEFGTTVAAIGLNVTGGAIQLINSGNVWFAATGGNAQLPNFGVFAWSATNQANGSQDTGLQRVAAKVASFSDGGTNANGWLQWAGQSRVTSDFSVTSSTTLTNVTGLSVNVQAGRTYTFIAEISWTDAAAGGIQAAIAGTATATNIIYDGWIIDSAANGIKGNAQATALGTAVASSTTTGTAGHLTIQGTITVNAAGTLTVQMAQNASNGTATVAKRGSSFIVQDMP